MYSQMGSASFSISGSGSSSLVLDRERGELIRAPMVRMGKKGTAKNVLDEKAVLALKNHSEAERRRRERINSHLSVLRGMIHGTEKLDKAALLGEVINHVKRLKAHTASHTKGHTVPSDTDEVTIRCMPQTVNSFLLHASICCDDSPDLFSELKQNLKNLKVKIVRTEICSIGGRVKIVFVMMSENDASVNIWVESVRGALRSVLEKINNSMEFVPRESLLNKRRKISNFESSSSSS